MRSSTTAPIQLPAIRAGEIDGRFVDVTSDLGAVDDQIPSLAETSIAITRRDGFAMTSDDLALALTDWPNTLDDTHLILTIGLAPPALAAGRRYRLTLTVDKTLQGRLFIRDLDLDVVAAMG